MGVAYSSRQATHSLTELGVGNNHRLLGGGGQEAAVLARGLGVLAHLHKLDLSNISFGASCCQELAQSLAGCTRLQQLVLTDNGLRGAGIAMIAKHALPQLASTLRELDLSHNSAELGCSELCATLPLMRRLELFGFISCLDGTLQSNMHQMQQLIQVLVQLPQLWRADLSENDLTSAEEDQLRKLVEHSKCACEIIMKAD